MSDFLEDIVQQKRREIFELAKSKPLSLLMAEIEKNPPQPRAFKESLLANEPKPSIIAELKKKSPSRGLLRESYNIEDIAKSYTSGGASALSVLTDKEFFDGDLSHIARAKSSTHLPVLRKDFILDPYQVYESLHAGADAFLLIAAILSRDEIIEMTHLAGELGLGTLVEVHQDEDLPKIASLRNAMIGINNRDLRTFQVNLRTTARLAPRLSNDHFIVSESGIQHHDDLVFLASLGVQAVLVGESLLISKDPGLALKKLKGRA